MDEYKTFANELALIQDARIRVEAEYMLVNAPLKFYSIPASGSGKYHSLDECGPGGNVLHTKRVVAMVVMLAPAFKLDQHAQDLVVAAALIHDILKQGPLEEAQCSKAEYNMHGPNLYIWYQETQGEPDFETTCVLDIASRHMGVWSAAGFQPVTERDRCLAMADYVASRKPLAAAIPLV